MVKNLPAIWETRFNLWVGKISWRKEWQSIAVFLPGKSHGQKNLAGYSPWGHKDQTGLKQLSKYWQNCRKGKELLISV